MKTLIHTLFLVTLLSSEDKQLYKGTSYVCFGTHSADLSDELQIANDNFTLKKVFRDYLVGVTSEVVYKG